MKIVSHSYMSDVWCVGGGGGGWGGGGGCVFFFFNDTATTEIYTLSLHDALPIWAGSIIM